MNSSVLAQAIEGAKAVRQTALANAKMALTKAFEHAYDEKFVFMADIHYPEGLHKLVFDSIVPDGMMFSGFRKFRDKDYLSPFIHLRIAVERFKKCMPAERKTVVKGVTYKYKLQEFSLTEKNKGSVNSFEDYSFIGKVKVVPHFDNGREMFNEFEAGRLRFFYKGEVEVDEKTNEVTEIVLSDIILKSANP